jgi:hypothetical protein
MRNREIADLIDTDSSDLSRQQYTRDLLVTLSEADVRQAEKDLKKEISAVRARNRGTYDLEIELCYVQDEINRRDAVSAHMNYKDA